MGDSALSPREIQHRIRSGESLDEVARAAGVEPARVEPFAVPVLAEREFIAGLARSNPARRGGETIAHRTLGDVVNDRLLPRQVDPDTVRWDAWKLEGRRWAVQVSWAGSRQERDARFVYDQAGRFSVPDNDDARWLVGLRQPGPETPASPADPQEAEPTVGLNDDLALVRVVQPGPALDDTEPIDLEDDGFGEDAYAEAELTEVDGVYDIVTNPTGGIDVLYDMLSGFDEDSVQIYSGLMRPEAGRPATPGLGAGPPRGPARPPRCGTSPPGRTPTSLRTTDRPRPRRPQSRPSRSSRPCWRRPRSPSPASPAASGPRSRPGTRSSSARRLPASPTRPTEPTGDPSGQRLLLLRTPPALGGIGRRVPRLPVGRLLSVALR